MYGLLYALESVASLLLMCDKMDLGTTIGEGGLEPVATEPSWQDLSSAAEPGQAREFFEPTLYIYDAYPGGIGLSEPLFRIHDLLASKTRDLIASCACEKGCPSCVGPAGETGQHAKEAALAILERLCS
jgi:DEAD/DEAH box helicase domain-containing protein